jgi:hypothetical protein
MQSNTHPQATTLFTREKKFGLDGVGVEEGVATCLTFVSVNKVRSLLTRLNSSVTSSVSKCLASCHSCSDQRVGELSDSPFNSPNPPKHRRQLID